MSHIKNLILCGRRILQHSFHLNSVIGIVIWMIRIANLIVNLPDVFAIHTTLSPIPSLVCSNEAIRCNISVGTNGSRVAHYQPVSSANIRKPAYEADLQGLPALHDRLIFYRQAISTSRTWLVFHPLRQLPYLVLSRRLSP